MRETKSVRPAFRHSATIWASGSNSGGKILPFHSTNFGANFYGVVPDMLNFAKCVTNGVIPLGGVIVRDKLYDAMMNTNAPEHVVEFFHGYTYSAHPLACAAGLAALDLYREEDLFARAKKIEPTW